MLKLMGAMVASSFILAGGANAGTLVYQVSGVGPAFSEQYLSLPGPGTYRFTATTSLPAYIDFLGGYTYHYDYFAAPSPRPHSEYIEGNSWEEYDYGNDIAVAFEWVFVVPKMTRTFFDSGTNYLPYGIPVGTRLYREVRYENPFTEIGIEGVEEGVPISYSFSITRSAGVPEPTTWAMMIAGFGLTGAAIRRRRFQPA